MLAISPVTCHKVAFKGLLVSSLVSHAITVLPGMLPTVPAVLPSVAAVLTSVSAVAAVARVRLGCGCSAGCSAGADDWLPLNGSTFGPIRRSAHSNKVGTSLLPKVVEEALSTIQVDHHVQAIHILRAIEIQADISCQGNGSILACATHTSTSAGSIGVTFHRNGSIRVEGEKGCSHHS